MPEVGRPSQPARRCSPPGTSTAAQTQTTGSRASSDSITPAAANPACDGSTRPAGNTEPILHGYHARHKALTGAVL
jgi:hypothetical protein